MFQAPQLCDHAIMRARAVQACHDSTIGAPNAEAAKHAGTIAALCEPDLC